MKVNQDMFKKKTVLEIKNEAAEEANRMMNKQKPKDVYKYKLVGNFIRVIKIDGDGHEICVKKVPLEKATAQMISKIENVSPLEKFIVAEKVKKAKEESKAKKGVLSVDNKSSSGIKTLVEEMKKEKEKDKHNKSKTPVEKSYDTFSSFI